MRGWTAERQRIIATQTSPRNHDGLIWDSALAARNARELETAEMDMVDHYVAADDMDALEEDDTMAAEIAAVYADAERCERPA